MNKDYLYVGAQLVLFLIFLLPVPALRFSPGLLGWIGLPLSIAGLLFLLVALAQLGTSFTPFPSPKTAGRLVTTGTYAVARHPIYAAILPMLGGWGLAHGNGFQLLVVLVLSLLFYYKSRYEEGKLRRAYPGYAAYARSTPRFGWPFGK